MESVTPARRPAAVLIPVYAGPAGPTLLLIRRTPGGIHSGQVAFPGGRPEPGDRDLAHTALREAQEEIGVDPALVTIVGSLPVVETIVSNYEIHSFVGRLAAQPAVMPQESEVAAVLHVPFSTFLEEAVEEWWDLPAAGDAGPRRRLTRFYPWGEDRIWGATARIIEHLVAAVQEDRITL